MSTSRRKFSKEFKAKVVLESLKEHVTLEVLAQSVWAVNAMAKKKIIVVTFGSPYLVNEYFERVNTCINAYSNTAMMQEAVISALMGKTKMEGTSPVSLDIASKFR